MAPFKPPVPRAPRPPSAALRLLRKLVATRWFELDAIARALVVSDARLAAYLSESEPIPLDRQLCLALFVIEFIADKVPTVDHVWDVIHTFIRPAAGAVGPSRRTKS